jgi:hypothetical protein
MTYRIVPHRRIYRVEAVSPDGLVTVLGIWRTEEAAVSHLRSLQRQAEIAARPVVSLPGKKLG